MKIELRTLLAAIVFYTRIPISKEVVLDEQAFQKASKYLPLIGWLIGCFQALLFVVLHWFLPLRVCVVLTIIVGILLTGALHEDGFIDCCDAFGAGKGRDETLHIMKNSNIGAFGVIGYIALFFLKIELFVAIAEFGVEVVILSFIVAQSLSRLMPLWFIITDPYARLSDESSKSKVLICGTFERNEIIVALACGAVPLLFLQSVWLVVVTSIMLVGLKRMLSSYFTRCIGGYTGDCLGAVQQISELIIYFNIVLIWNFF